MQAKQKSEEKMNEAAADQAEKTTATEHAKKVELRARTELLAKEAAEQAERAQALERAKEAAAQEKKLLQATEKELQAAAEAERQVNEATKRAVATPPPMNFGDPSPSLADTEQPPTNEPASATAPSVLSTAEEAPVPPPPRRDLKPRAVDSNASVQPPPPAPARAPVDKSAASVAGRGPPPPAPPSGQKPSLVVTPASAVIGPNTTGTPVDATSPEDIVDDDDDDDDGEEEEDFHSDDDDVAEGDDVDAAVRKKVSTSLDNKVARGVITEAERMHIAAVAEALAAGLERSPSPKLSLAEPEPSEAGG